MLKSFRSLLVFGLGLVVLIVLASCGASPGVTTATLYMPSDATTTKYDSGGYSTFTSTTDFMFQILLPEAELDGLPVGATITGMRLQPCNDFTCGDWVDTTVTQFEVRLSTSENEAGSLSLTFSENRGADEVIVIPETSWEIVAADYHNDECQAHAAAGTGPCAFGPVINFENPFVYAGGSILMETASVGGKTDDFYVQKHPYGTDVVQYLSVTDFNDARVATHQTEQFHHIAFVYTTD